MKTMHIQIHIEWAHISYMLHRAMKERKRDDDSIQGSDKVP